MLLSYAREKSHMHHKILIFGASGMLGSMLFSVLTRHGFEVWGSVRKRGKHVFFQQKNIVDGVNVDCFPSVEAVIKSIKPDIIINAVAVTSKSSSLCQTFRINTLFPLFLQKICLKKSIRLIHYSTDAVFCKSNTPKNEKSCPFPVTLYGLTKLWGEPVRAPALTIRTSMIGPELETRRHLLEWFLSATTPVRGHAHTCFGGLTTLEHANILVHHIIPAGDLHGLYHVAGPTITKSELLFTIAKIYEKKIQITPVASQEGHVLDGSCFQKRTQYAPPSWDSMLTSMRVLTQSSGDSHGY